MQNYLIWIAAGAMVIAIGMGAVAAVFIRRAENYAHDHPIGWRGVKLLAGAAALFLVSFVPLVFLAITN